MKILSLSLDLELSQLRMAALRAAGHTVTVMTSEREGLQAVQSPDRYDVVLLCHHFPSAAARQAVRLLRHHHPDTHIVYIVHVYGEWPEVEADRYVVGADGPEALLRVLAEVHDEPQGVTELDIS
jgi:DNA-binding response OmpR family regulator